MDGVISNFQIECDLFLYLNSVFYRIEWMPLSQLAIETSKIDKILKFDSEFNYSIPSTLAPDLE